MKPTSAIFTKLSGVLINIQKHQTLVFTVGEDGSGKCGGKEQRSRVNMAGFKSSSPFASCVPWSRFLYFLCLSFLV